MRRLSAFPVSPDMETLPICVVGLGNLPFPLLSSSCGWTNTQDRLTGEKEIFICEHAGLIEMVPKKWPRKGAFIFFRQRNNMRGIDKTKKLGFWVLN